MSLTDDIAPHDLLDSQNRLLHSSRQILEQSIATMPDAPPRFHWNGDARNAYATRLSEFAQMLRRAEVHIEAAARASAVTRGA